MSKATRSSPSPCPPQGRDQRGSSDCAYSLKYSTPTPALQLQCPKGQTEVKGPAARRELRLEEGPRCPGSYTLLISRSESSRSVFPQQPPNVLPLGSLTAVTPEVGVKGGSRRFPPS